MLSRISLQRIGGVLMGDEAGGRRRGAAVAAVVRTRCYQSLITDLQLLRVRTCRILQ